MQSFSPRKILRFPAWQHLQRHGKFCIPRLEIQISRLKIYIFSLKMHISKLKTDFCSSYAQTHSDKQAYKKRKKTVYILLNKKIQLSLKKQTHPALTQQTAYSKHMAANADSVTIFETANNESYNKCPI